MKKYTYIAIMALLSGVFVMQTMESGDSSAGLVVSESREDDSGSVVYVGSSSDSDSNEEGLDGALLRSKHARSKAELEFPLRRLSAIGATKESLVRRAECEIPGLHAAAAERNSSDLEFSADESDISRCLAVRPPLYQGALVSKSRYPDRILRNEEAKALTAAAAASAVIGHQRSRSYAEVFDGAGVLIATTAASKKHLPTLEESEYSSDSEEDSLSKLVARLDVQKKSVRK